jgi:hypothetical protein
MVKVRGNGREGGEMPSDLTALAALASRTVVAAASADDASSDEWGAAKRGVARLLGRGDPERQLRTERQLDQTRDQLQAAAGQEREKRTRAEEAAWRDRLEHLLMEHPDVADGLRQQVDQIRKASKHAQWRDALQPIPRILRWYKDNAVAGILLAAGFVVFKGYVLARGDVATALGILQYAGLATVVTAGLLSSLPILTAAMLAYTVSRVLTWILGKSRSHESKPAFTRPLLVVTLGAFVLAALFAPWTYLALACVIGLAIALMRTLRARERAARLVAGLVRALLASAAVLAVIFSLYAVWVPHEVVYFRPGTLPQNTAPRTEQVGYVLSEGNGWITILTSGAHRIVHYPDARVTAQMVCEKSSELTDAPTLWDTVTGLNSVVKSVLHPAAPRPCPH